MERQENRASDHPCGGGRERAPRSWRGARVRAHFHGRRFQPRLIIASAMRWMVREPIGTGLIDISRGQAHALANGAGDQNIADSWYAHGRARNSDYHYSCCHVRAGRIGARTKQLFRREVKMAPAPNQSGGLFFKEGYSDERSRPNETWQSQGSVSLGAKAGRCSDAHGPR